MTTNKNKKNKDEKKIEKDDLSRIENSFLSDSDENRNKDLPDNLDEIKKLASDFSMEEDSYTDEENKTNIQSSDEEPDETYSDDFLDRLSDIQSEKPFVTEEDNLNAFESRIENIQEKHDISKKPSKEDNDQVKALPFVPSSEESKSLEDIHSELKSKKKPISIDDIQNEAEEISEQSQSNEDFVDRLKSSLEEDETIQHQSKSTDESSVFTTFDGELDDSELFKELEKEIENAEKSKNPFVTDSDLVESDGFLENLDKITIPEIELEDSSSEMDQLEELVESELMLSSSSWKDVLNSTDDDLSKDQSVFAFDEEQSFDDMLENVTSSETDEKSTYPLLSDGEDVSLSSDQESDLQEDTPDDYLSNEDSDGESVEGLRRSFIDEFDQSAFDAEMDQKSKKKWLPRNIETFNKWFKSLSISEKILIFLSFFISLAVIVSIVLVITQWSINNRRIANPPPAIESTDQDLIYPTGLELPGGWFFFLERGEIQENKWEPQNAEWLANTKLRRVIAVPWSNQSESVVRSLTTADEISLFMNNNDIVVYQVEEVIQISRDNVRILSDTEPSLVVILFREDNEDRWTVIAKPKPIE